MTKSFRRPRHAQLRRAASAARADGTASVRTSTPSIHDELPRRRSNSKPRGKR